MVEHIAPLERKRLAWAETLVGKHAYKGSVTWVQKAADRFNGLGPPSSASSDA